jgi:sugar/nucleoside kinase (ribokinase family)
MRKEQCMSRTYNVYGIGNALVDIQYRVEPAFLEQAGIAKGLMTLIDEGRHNDLMAQLKDQPGGRASGGSAANTVIGVANLGGTARYACKVADDAFGDFYLKDLSEARVAADAGGRGHGVTGKCLVFITPDADRTMNTFLGISAAFGPGEVEEDGIADSDFLYIEGYLIASDSGFEAAATAQEMARRHGTRVALTLSDPSIVEAFKPRMSDLVEKGVDLLFCNEEEAMAFTGTKDTEKACTALGTRVSGYAVTQGADGAVVSDGKAQAKLPGFKVEAVDTNGAGDMFAGAYLFGITNGYDLAQSAKLATYASSRVVAKYGPRLDVSLESEVDRILAA